MQMRLATHVRFYRGTLVAGLPYNGWSELIRHGRDKHYYHAQSKKLLPQVAACLLCKCDLPESCIPYHAEEYGPAIEDYWSSCVPLCHRCHAMLHARFVTPNRWFRYVRQAVSGEIDQAEYPQSKFIAPMLSRFKKRPDMGSETLPGNAPDYIKALPMAEYTGHPKVATLKVIEHSSGQVIEVPDWTLYGESLENLSETEMAELERRSVDVSGFLSGKIEVERDKSGKRVYRRLYA